MEFIRLGTFCQIINSSLLEKINSDFEFKKNQESVVTMILRILSYDSNDELDKKYMGKMARKYWINLTAVKFVRERKKSIYPSCNFYKKMII